MVDAQVTVTNSSEVIPFSRDATQESRGITSYFTHTAWRYLWAQHGTFSKARQFLIKTRQGETLFLLAREFLWRATKVSPEVPAKIRLVRVTQTRRDLFVRKALGQEDWREAYSLANYPCLGRRMKLLAEATFERAHSKPYITGQDLYGKTLLPDDEPKFLCP